MDSRPATHRKLLACDEKKPVAERSREVLERFAPDAPEPESEDPVVKMAHRLKTKATDHVSRGVAHASFGSFW